MEQPDGSAVFCWAGPFRIGDYLAGVVSERDSRPPDAPGVYVLSEQAWKGIPDGRADLIYTGQTHYLRYRIGQLLCDLLGFTGDDPADEEAYEHRGGHVLWHYCIARGVEPVNLHLSWCAPCKCMDCAVSTLLELTPFGSALARRRNCSKHHPALDLAYNCSAPVTRLGSSAPLNSNKN